MNRTLTLCLSALSAGLLIAGTYTGALQKQNLEIPSSADSRGSIAYIEQTPRLRSVARRAAQAYTVPFKFTPTEAEFEECLIENCNGDSKTWKFSENAFYSEWNSSNEMDDWIFLPAIQLDAAPYKFSIEFKTRGSDLENFEIMMGTSRDVAGMTIPLAKRENYTDKEYKEESVQFDAPAAGEYYIGIHCFSGKNKFGCYFRNISVTSLDLSSPRGVEFTSVESEGYDVDLLMKLPSETLGGDALTGTVGVDLNVDGSPWQLPAPITGAPGETVSARLTLASGTHTVEATAYTEIDGTRHNSEPTSVQVKVTKIMPVPIPLPALITPDRDEFEWCEVVDVNGDENTWKWIDSGNPDNSPSFFYSYSYIRDADDWLLLPAFGCEKKGAYQVSVDVATKYNAEGFEICWATTRSVDAMKNNVIISQPEVKTDNTWQTFTGRFFLAEGENVYLGIHCTSPKNASYIYLKDLTLAEADGSMPATPVFGEPDFDGGNGTLRLALPSVDFAGAPLTAETLYAEITLDGDSYGETLSGAPGTDLTVSFSSLPLGNHTVGARCYFMRDGEKIYSDPAETTFRVKLPSDFAYSLPMHLALNKSDADNLVIFNANGDDKTWEAMDDCMRYSYHFSNPADDWIFTAPVDITDVSRLLNVAIDAKCNYGDEAFDIFLGTAQNPESMTILILDAPKVDNSDFKTFTADFSLPEAGKYYVGIHAKSAANKFYLSVKDFNLSLTDKTLDTPAAPTDITAVPDQTGHLSATVSFRLPTHSTTGAELAADEELTATVVSSVATATVKGMPGAEVSTEIATAEGDNEISIYVSNASGDGMTATVGVKCGLDKPNAPVITKAEVTADNLGLLLEWNPVTTGQTGGVVNPSAMRYRIYEYDPNDEDWYFIDDTDLCQFTYELSASYPQEVMHIAVDAYNAVNSGSPMSAVSAVLGKPYSLPMDENFANGRLHYSPLSLASSLDAEYAPEWSVKNPATVTSGATCESGFALVGHTVFNRGDSKVNLPKFSTVDYKDVVFRTSVYIYSGTPQITVSAKTFGSEPQELLTVETGETGWKEFSCTLPENLTGKEWVEITYNVNFNLGSTNNAIIGTYAIEGTSLVGVDEIQAGFGVRALRGAIEITGAQGNSVTVFRADGSRAAYLAAAGDSERIALPAGIYMVRIGEKTIKACVR